MPGQATDERSRPPEPLFHFLRNRCSTSSGFRVPLPGFAVPLPPESLFHFLRIPCSTSSGIPNGLACGPIIVVLRMEVSAPDVGRGALVCASPFLMGKCLRGQELRPPIVDGAEYGDGAGTVGPARGGSTPTARSEYAQGGPPVRPRRGAGTPRALSWYAQGGSCVRPGRRVLPPAVNSGGAQGAAVPWAHGAVGGGFRVLPVVRLCSGGSACALNTFVLHMALGAPGVGCGALACASWSLLGQCSRGEDTRSALVERGQYAHRVRLVRPARTVTVPRAVGEYAQGGL